MDFPELNQLKCIRYLCHFKKSWNKCIFLCNSGFSWLNLVYFNFYLNLDTSGLNKLKEIWEGSKLVLYFFMILSL